jgi:hypothetical protein
MTGTGFTGQTKVLFDNQEIGIASMTPTQIVTQEVPQGLLTADINHEVKLQNGSTFSGGNNIS